MEYVSEIGQLAGVKRMAFSHHDPGRTDDALDQIVESVRSDLKEKGSPMHVFAAADGQVVELDASATTRKISRGKFSTTPATAPAVKDSSVLMGVSDAGLALVLTEAARVEGVCSAPETASSFSAMRRFMICQEYCRCCAQMSVTRRRVSKACEPLMPWMQPLPCGWRSLLGRG